MRKFILVISALSISLSLSAQSSGGQIRRPKTVQSKSTSKVNKTRAFSKAKSSFGYSEEELENKYEKMSMSALKKYVNQGDAMAQFFYGFNFAQREDYEKAVIWYRKAAYQGLIRAQLWLAYCYYHGKGIRKDTTVAREWLKKAASKGSEDAKEYLKTWY